MSTDSTVSSTNISAKFQYAARLADIPALSTETKKPTFTSIYHLFLVDKLLANASSIPYPGTDLGHISLVLTDQEEFLTINNKNIASNPPADPGPTIVTPQGATSAQIQQLHRDHATHTCIYNTHIDTKQLLRKFIISKVDDNDQYWSHCINYSPQN